MTQEELYSKLYRIAGYILRDANPCQIKAEDGSVSCAATRHPRSTMVSPGNAALCCGSYYPNDPGQQRGYTCPKWEPTKGCTVENLPCKLFLCGLAADANRDVDDALRLLLRIAHGVFVYPGQAYTFLAFFKSKEELFASRR